MTPRSRRRLVALAVVPATATLLGLGSATASAAPADPLSALTNLVGLKPLATSANGPDGASAMNGTAMNTVDGTPQ